MKRTRLRRQARRVRKDFRCNPKIRVRLAPCKTVLVSSPVHLEALLRSGVKPKRLDRILTATAPMTKDLALGLQRRFETRVQDIFGCTEAGTLATRDATKGELWTYADVFELYTSREGVRIHADHLPEDVLLPDIVELVGDRQYRWLGRQADMINIAAKYEHRTKIEMTNDTEVDDVGMFPDGETTRSDLPGMFTLGAQLQPIQKLTASVGFDYYLDIPAYYWQCGKYYSYS